MMLLFVFTLWLGGCSDTSTKDSGAGANGRTGGALNGRLVLSGSSTVAPLAGEIAKRFEAMHPQVRVDVQSGGSSRGIADVQRGLVEIGMVSRAIKPQEDGLKVHQLAMDGVCMLIHRDNPVAALTDAQIVLIYTGKVSNWSEVGGSDAAITVIHKAEGRATLEVFLNHFQIENKDIKPAIIIGENQQVIRTVASDVNAIGYVSIGTAEYEAGQGSPIRLLPMNGVEATVDHVRDGTFGMSRPLSFVTHGNITPLAEQFIVFAQSAAADDLIEADYFVPAARD